MCLVLLSIIILIVGYFRVEFLQTRQNKGYIQLLDNPEQDLQPETPFTNNNNDNHAKLNENRFENRFNLLNKIGGKVVLVIEKRTVKMMAIKKIKLGQFRGLFLIF